MTYREMRLSLQLETDLRVGFIVRERQREAKAIEDAAFAALRSAVGPEP